MKGESSYQTKAKKGAQMVKMAKGGAMNEGKTMKAKGRGIAKADMQKVAGKAVKGHETRMHAKGGDVKKMAKGGGIEHKGKTKGKMIKMAKGGKAC